MSLPAAARAGDWPMWRCDAARTAVCRETLPSRLRLQWVRRLPPQRTAWRDETAMKFDRSYQPVVLGGLVFVGSTVNDRLTACELDTGRERWRFYAEGPLRTAPAAWKDRVFAASDDGRLYCLAADDGKLLWQFRGGPHARRLIGNERLISTWPVRGGPVVADGKVYFAAGVWPFMGTFVYALDARSGRVVWRNDSTSFTFRRMPHPGSAAFTGLSPQGHLAAVGDRLIVPGSAATPALFDRRTGAFCGYAAGTGPEVCGRGRLSFTRGGLLDVSTGHHVRLKDAGRLGLPVLGAKAWYTAAGAYDPASVKVREVTIQVPETTAKDGPTYPQQIFTGTLSKLRAGDRRRRARIDRPWLLAAGRLVTSRKDELQLIDASKGVPGQVLWRRRVGGEPSSVLAAGGRLLVATIEGDIYCFGERAGEPRTHAEPAQPNRPTGAWSAPAAEILRTAGVRDGYCMVWGLKDGGLVEELLRQSRLHVIAADADARKVGSLRRRLDEAGLYGPRAAVLVGRPGELSFAPYLASLIVSEDPPAGGLDGSAEAVRKLFAPLRPYGGAACLQLSAGEHERFAASVQQAALPGGEVRRSGGWTLLVRAGALPGSADWCGQNADAGNTRCSRDRLVKAPLGVLWFGNALSNSLILPRHGEGPVEQVAAGRMVIEGPDSLSASDVYTGRLLWSRRFPGLGRYYSIAKHQRGAHAIGANFYAVADAVYVAAGNRCHVLDPATGRTSREFRFADESEWLFLLVHEDLLIAGSHPTVKASPGKNPRYNTPATSRGLVAMDRRSGQVRWRRKAAKGFGHYGVAAGRGKVFCFDQLSAAERARLKRRGGEPADKPRLLALDARTGRLLWASDRFSGPKLSYSAEHDVVLAGGALRGADGTILWAEPETRGYARHKNPGLDSRDAPLWWGKWGPMLRGRTIYTQGMRAFDLLTGVQRAWTDAAGKDREWRYHRSHGCGPMAGAWHLITLRSGCAGFFDLARDGGTGNLGGFRSGCTSNLIAANGVLNAPDYTRTCGCAYQNRSSLGLIHMPEVEYWTFGARPAPGRAGFNFGAPGDRRADDGTLWRETPCQALPKYGGRTLVATVPADCRRFYHHVSRMKGPEARRWIGGSGLIGLRAARLPLDGLDPARELVLRLYFAEPEHEAAGRRIFSVELNGSEIARDLDVFREAGGGFRTIVKEVDRVRVDPAMLDNSAAPAGLRLTFRAKVGEPLLCGAELIEADKLRGVRAGR